MEISVPAVWVGESFLFRGWLDQRFIVWFYVLLDVVNKNHEKAPLCAAFVQSMREMFGDVQVLYVKESDVELGQSDQATYATAFQISVSKNAQASSKAQANEETS